MNTATDSKTMIRIGAVALLPFLGAAVSAEHGYPALPSMNKNRLEAVVRPGSNGSTVAPYGPLLRCQLVNAVVCPNRNPHVEAPVIGLITQNLYWGGNCILPVNSEVHGVTTGERLRDRVRCDANWIIVFRDAYGHSRELKVRGLALDREVEAPDRDGRVLKFGKTDGSLGLRAMQQADDVRVPAGKAFDLYLEQALDAGEDHV